MRKELIHPVSLLLVTVTASTLTAQLPAGWTSRDIGSPAAAGNAQYDQATETWTIRGDGTGLRGTADQFQYVYKTLSGDGELAARVVSIDPPLADWSTAGVMIRVLLTPGSPYIFQGISANTDGQNHAITMWGREAFDATADHESTGAMTPPYWVKVKRTGDTFASYSSPDGKEWTQRYSTDAPGIPKSIYIGYAVTSDVGGELITAVFDRGPRTASGPDPADGARNVVTPLLRWTPGITAVAHNVYFGTNPALGDAEFRERLPLTTTTYYHAAGLTPSTTYCWRIDEIGADGTTIYPGDVWHFTSAPATAYAPEPWNGLDGVDVHTSLTWSMGTGAISHDVYFGADKAAVAAGDPGVFRGNHVVPKYEPGPLTLNTTYFWRIDEHDVTGEIHTGEVWSFATTGPGLGVKAQYFRGIDAAGVPVLTRIEDAIDHDWGSSEVVPGLSDGVSAVWTANLEAPFTESYRLITTTDDGVRLWLDGRRLIDNWTNHGSTDDMATVSLVAGQFYLLRMEWYENGGSAVARLSWQSPSIPRRVIPAGPLQLPVRATGPYPAHTSANATHTPLLRWSAGQQATDHDLYFGDDADAVANANTTTAGIYQGRQALDETTFDPGTLEWKKSYYWRVDEVNAAEAHSPWTGALWSFTTADFLVIDDFESYTDDEGNRIYETWLDDWDVIVTGGFGAIVGYGEAPFAEQTIVHSGGQSMPLDYNNVGSPYYSEIERQFLHVQDWTVNGVDTLVLHVRGKPGNVAAPLYVRLDDSAGKTATVTHADAGVANATTWVEWKIPLSEFAGVNAAKIKKIYLGLGDVGGLTPGGHGLIYIDDIRVIKSQPAGM
jgi:hypothetical protein